MEMTGYIFNINIFILMMELVLQVVSEYVEVFPYELYLILVFLALVTFILSFILKAALLPLISFILNFIVAMMSLGVAEVEIISNTSIVQVLYTPPVTLAYIFVLLALFSMLLFIYRLYEYLSGG